MRRLLASLNRHWKAGWCYTAVAVPFAIGIASAVLNSRALETVATVLAFAGAAVNISYAVPLVRLLRRRTK